jgi:hypothetical protein
MATVLGSAFQLKSPLPRFEKFCKRVSGDPPRETPKRVARLKAFRVRCNASGNLIFAARWEARARPYRLPTVRLRGRSAKCPKREFLLLMVLPETSSKRGFERTSLGFEPIEPDSRECAESPHGAILFAQWQRLYALAPFRVALDPRGLAGTGASAGASAGS